MNFEENDQQVPQKTKQKSFFSVFDPSEESPLFRKPFWAPVSNSSQSISFGSVIFSSKLQKKSKTFGHWITRYYFLFDNYLAYGNSKQVSKIKKYLVLDGIKIWLPDSKNTKSKEKRLAFFRCNKTLILRAQDEILLKDWLGYLRNKCIMTNLSSCYEMVHSLGTGSYGKVYLVKDKVTEKSYAAKVISKEQMVAKQIGVSILNTEINTLRRLNHPNIIKLREVFETTTSVYLILEYVDGDELYTVLKKKIFYKESECIPILKNLLETIVYLHKKLIVHRDLKPENLLIPTGKLTEVKLIDFGLALDLSKPHDGKRGGTPGYIAPEVLNFDSGKAVQTEKSDMFSIGCIFYRLLTGTKLFKGNNSREIFEKNKECVIDLNKSSLSHISNDARDLLERFLSKNMKKRITAAEALQHSFFYQQKGGSLNDLIESDENVDIPTVSQYTFDVIKNKETRDPKHKSASRIFDSRGTFYVNPHTPFDQRSASNLNQVVGIPKSFLCSLNNFDMIPNSPRGTGGESPSRLTIDEQRYAHLSAPNSPANLSKTTRAQDATSKGFLTPYSNSSMAFQNSYKGKMLAPNVNTISLEISTKMRTKEVFSDYLRGDHDKGFKSADILTGRRDLDSIGEEDPVQSMPNGI